MSIRKLGRADVRREYALLSRTHGRDRRKGPGRWGGFIGRLIVRHAGLIVLVSLLSAVFCAYVASHLTINNDFSALIPPKYESVKALERLRAAVGGESEAAVVIESPSFDANRRFAEALIPEVLGLKTEQGEAVFTRVDYRRDVRFVEANALYLASDAELDSVEALLKAEIEAARLAANPFFFDLEDSDEAGDARSDQLRSTYENLVGREYPISADSTVLVLRFYPGGAQTDIAYIEAAYAALQRAVDRLEPEHYDAQMDVLLAGRLLRQLIEVRTITGDVQKSFGAGVMIVLMIVTGYFGYRAYRARAGRRLIGRLLLHEIARAPVAAAVIGLPLLAALCWTFATAYAVLGALNMMTSTLGLVLFGLGIDYGIHYYGRYAQEREHGRSVADAVRATTSSTGAAVAVTAITTSGSFLVLTLADFRGFSEFGFIAGVGILFALTAMVIFLPSLLVIFERLHLLDLSPAFVQFHEVGEPPHRRLGRARTICAFGAVSIALSIALLPGVAFEYDFGKLEPEYEAYRALQQRVRTVYDDRGHRNPAYVIVDDPADAVAVRRALEQHAAADSLTPTIARLESFQGRFPQTPGEQALKLDRIAHLRSLLDDPFLRQSDSDWLARLRLAASTTAPPRLEDVPHYLRSPFTTRSGSIGRLVVIYPSVGLSDARQSMAFADDVAVIRTPDGKIHHAGSTALVAADMLRLMRMEAPMMVILTFLIVLGIKFLLLRSLRLTAVATVPLVGGFLAMFGLTALLDVSLNFYNLVVLPVVLGVGDDAGIHLVHRYREEGPGSIRNVLRSAGEPVIMSALTTVVGFGGLVLSFYPGLRSIGLLAMLGISATLLFAIVILPALLQVLEDRGAAADTLPRHRLARPMQLQAAD